MMETDNNNNIRLLVVDDSRYFQRLIVDFFSDEPDIRIIGFAGNGAEGVDMARSLRPDVILMDIVMPEMDGIRATEIIMRENPIPILIFTSSDENDAALAIEALHRGAMDFILKTRIGELKNPGREIAAKIRILSRVKATRILPGISTRGRLGSQRSGTQKAMRGTAVRQSGDNESDIADGLVVIGASTGSPTNVRAIIAALPGDFPFPVVVAVHMPELFTGIYAHDIDQCSLLSVKEAEHDEKIRKGFCYIARGGSDCEIYRNRLRIVLPDYGVFIPSIDRLMKSAAGSDFRYLVGIVLSGMGNDGAAGLLEIRRRGGYTIAQDQGSCAIFGMPREAIRADAATAILSPDEIIGLLSRPADDLVAMVRENAESSKGAAQ